MRLVAPSIHQLYSEVLTLMLDSDLESLGYKETSAEVIGAQLVLTEPTANLIATRGRKFNYRYMVAEMLWNAQPTTSITPLEQVMSKIVDYVQDQPEGERDTVAWAYGPSVYQGLKYCWEELVNDPGSRRAVIRVHHNPLRTGTPPCLVSQQFIIRGNRLHSIVQMRSNDLWRGFPLDVYQFTMWQIILASKLGLQVGNYHHFVGSLHLYERDRIAAVKMLDYGLDTIYSTTPDSSFFDDLMKVRVLKAMTNERSDGLLGISQLWVDTYLGEPVMAEEFELLRSDGYGTGWLKQN